MKLSLQVLAILHKWWSRATFAVTAFVSITISSLNLMPVGIEAWVTQIPPITRGWLVLAVLTSLAVVSK